MSMCKRNKPKESPPQAGGEVQGQAGQAEDTPSAETLTPCEQTREESGITLAAKSAAERLLNEDEWQDCSIAAVSGIIEAACSVVLTSFTQSILHGDEVHRLWLLEACEAYISGKPLPPTRDSKNTQNQRASSLSARGGREEEDFGVKGKHNHT